MVHVLYSEVVEKYARSGTCPDCKKRTRFAIYTYEWFDTDMTCLRCGRSFNEDGWVPLTFERRSRQKALSRAKERFRNTVAIGVDEMLRRVNSA